MRRTIILAASGLLLLSCLTSAGANGPDGEMASAWNRAVLQLAESEDGFLTLKGLRTVTLMHLAMHDALNSADGPYATFALEDDYPAGDPIAAASQAAYAVAADQYPGAMDNLRQMRDQWLAGVPLGKDRDSGLALGTAAARSVLELRAADGWDREAEYRWHPMAPGVYAEFREHSGTPEGFIFGAGWGEAQGFALTRPDQFRAPPPPAIESSDYARAFDEVKREGRFQSPTRTPDQTHLALWWKDFAENSHNRLARDLVAKENLDLIEANRLFALLNMAIYDGYVSSFNNKFHYNHWRPYTAIRWADNDGNPQTEAEPDWTNLHRHTYAFPSYPSAHGTACAAAMTAFASVLGDDYAFTMRIPEVDIAGPFSGKIRMQPPTREFSRFSDAAMECALSRIYLGIHFRYDSIEGYALGQRVGRQVVDTALTSR